MPVTYFANIFDVIGQIISDCDFLLAGVALMVGAERSNIAGWNYFDLKSISVLSDLQYSIFQTNHQTLKRVEILCRAVLRS